MFKKRIFIACICLLFFSCEFFKKEELSIPIARVNNVFLYQSDIKDLVSESTSKEDSTIIVNNYINTWATQQLLIANAKINLTENKQNEFNKLVNQYKSDLFSNAYLEALVNQSIDTSISLNEAQSVYERNKETFKLNEELIKYCDTNC